MELMGTEGLIFNQLAVLIIIKSLRPLLLKKELL